MATLHLVVLIATYAGYLLATYIFFTLSYNLAFHPLRKYPGPLLGKLSNFYGGYHSLTKRYHLTTWKNHQEYGSIVRQGPNRLVFNSVTALHDIYQNPRISKPYAYQQSRIAPNPTLFDTLETELHRRKRKILGQATSDRWMRLFEPTMLEQIDVFLKELMGSSHEPVNMTDRCNYLAIDVVGHLAFGYPLNLQTEEKRRPVPKGMALNNTRINLYLQFPEVSKFEAIVRWLGKKETEKFIKFFETMIRSRLSQEKDAKYDLYSLAADYYSIEGTEGLMSSELWTEAMFFLTAGGTTTATPMCAVFFYLSRNTHCYHKLIEEIRTTFKNGSEIRSGPQLTNCKYLRACIDEAIRLAPPSLAPLWRTQSYEDQGEEPIIVDGHVIPRGTEVAVSLYSLLHNEQYFPDPFDFKPERWLDPTAPENEEDQAARTLMHKAFAPFILGARGCPGKPMLYLEDSLTIAKTLWYFDFEQAPGDVGRVGEGRPGAPGGRHRVNEFQLFDNVTASHDGPFVVFRPREDVKQDLVKKA